MKENKLLDVIFKFSKSRVVVGEEDFEVISPIGVILGFIDSFYMFQNLDVKDEELHFNDIESYISFIIQNRDDILKNKGIEDKQFRLTVINSKDKTQLTEFSDLSVNEVLIMSLFLLDFIKDLTKQDDLGLIINSILTFRNQCNK